MPNKMGKSYEFFDFNYKWTCFLTGHDCYENNIRNLKHDTIPGESVLLAYITVVRTAFVNFIAKAQI